MSLDMETDVDRSEGSSIRDTVKASYASHTPSPDVTSIVNGAVEHDRAIRHRDRAKPVDYHQHAGDSSARLRSQIRGSIHETSLKAASGTSQPASKHEVPAGAPASWDLGARAAWSELPEPVQLAVAREQADLKNAIEGNLKPHLERLSEFDGQLSSIRHLYQRHGLSDTQGMAEIVRQVRDLHDPATAVQAYHELGRKLNIAPLGYQSQQQQYVEQQYADPQYQAEQAMHQHLAQFSQGKPHFEAVRYRMGELIRDHMAHYVGRDGNIDLDKAYTDACRHHGLGGDNRARRAANISPPSRAPSVRHDTSQRSGRSVRSDLLTAVRQSRGG